ncbi:MAG: hypothetical protein HC880_13800 [Bacteroidia bacterium]|nr:hypothetical protein [Bacteroidia bacterium]
MTDSFKPQGNLKDYWNKPVSQLVGLSNYVISEPEQERHKIYSLMLLALTFQQWNGNRYGVEGEYPMREKQKKASGLYREGDYLGHNIAAIAVDGNGRIIDFDFNHNNIFNSSANTPKPGWCGGPLASLKSAIAGTSMMKKC